ncbi:hypothetical protein OG900_38810 [Streptomyces sp. NBC_00433]
MLSVFNCASSWFSGFDEPLEGEGVLQDQARVGRTFVAQPVLVRQCDQLAVSDDCGEPAVGDGEDAR